MPRPVSSAMPNAAIEEPAGHVLGGGPEAGHLIVVNRCRPIHGNVRDDPASHQVDEQRSESGLDHVTADHRDYAAIGSGARRGWRPRQPGNRGRRGHRAAHRGTMQTLPRRPGTRGPLPVLRLSSVAGRPVRSARLIDPPRAGGQSDREASSGLARRGAHRCRCAAARRRRGRGW